MHTNFNIKEWNISQRKSAVCAMEYLARQINDEEMVDDSYIEPDNFAELMHEFLKVMHLAYKEDSGLYCGDVVSK